MSPYITKKWVRTFVRQRTIMYKQKTKIAIILIVQLYFVFLNLYYDPKTFYLHLGSLYVHAYMCNVYNTKVYNFYNLYILVQVKNCTNQ
jgi:hypothetical protein